MSIKQKKTSTTLFLMDIKMHRISTKIKWKIYIVFQVLKILLIKFLRYSHQVFYFLFFLLDFSSADLTFNKFLEPHSTLFEKKISVTNFPFLTDSFRTPNPLNCQHLFSETKILRLTKIENRTKKTQAQLSLLLWVKLVLPKMLIFCIKKLNQ